MNVSHAVISFLTFDTDRNRRKVIFAILNLNSFERLNRQGKVQYLVQNMYV